MDHISNTSNFNQAQIHVHSNSPIMYTIMSILILASCGLLYYILWRFSGRAIKAVHNFVCEIVSEYTSRCNECWTYIYLYTHLYMKLVVVRYTMTSITLLLLLDMAMRTTTITRSLTTGNRQYEIHPT